MSPGKVRAATVLEKSAQIDAMIRGVKQLPLDSLGSFLDDPRNAASAESYIRRALEALLDLGRHILAKGMGQGPAEYKEAALALQRSGVLDTTQGELMVKMAGYRNRMVHFYDEVSDEELFEIATRRVGEIRGLLEALIAWVRANPDKLDGTL